MNEERIVQALRQYQGTQESLTETVAVLTEELGENWTTDVFQKLGGLPVDLKEKLDHVFNYFAALTAWQETQGYLEQEEPFSDEIQQRLPVLKHWLDFFGEAGEQLYHQLEEKISSTTNVAQKVVSDGSEVSHEEVSQTENKVIEETVQPVDSTVEENVEIPEQKTEVVETVSAQKVVEKVPTEQTIDDAPVIEEAPSEQKVEEEVSQSEEETNSPSETESTNDKNSPEAFIVQKAMKEIALLDSVQAWLSARCLQLNNMEVFAYPYYGFVVDLMRQTLKDVQAALELEDKSFVQELYSEGEEGLSRKKQAIEADIETAVQNCESATTALIDENVDMDKVRKALGDLDENPDPEYLGPAPDGFELLEEEDKPLDEKAVKEQYQQLEKEVSEEQKGNDISLQEEKKTSQTVQNSVKRKLSFSFKPKKSGG